MVVHVTPWDKEHTHTRVRSILFAWWLDACAVGPKAFALRSHVNGIVGTCADRQTTPQVPRIPVSLFPRRPTAHAQATKSSPRPLASQKSRKTHCFRVKKNHFCDLMKNKSRTWITSGTCVAPEWRHALDINEWTKEMVFASWKKKSWALDEAIWYSGCNLWMTMVWLKGI